MNLSVEKLFNKEQLNSAVYREDVQYLQYESKYKILNRNRTKIKWTNQPEHELSFILTKLWNNS